MRSSASVSAGAGPEPHDRRALQEDRLGQRHVVDDRDARRHEDQPPAGEARQRAEAGDGEHRADDAEDRAADPLALHEQCHRDRDRDRGAEPHGLDRADQQRGRDAQGHAPLVAVGRAVDEPAADVGRHGDDRDDRRVGQAHPPEHAGRVGDRRDDAGDEGERGHDPQDGQGVGEQHERGEQADRPHGPGRHREPGGPVGAGGRVAEQAADRGRQDDPEGAGGPGEGGDVHGRTDLRGSSGHR
ncbi:hypothetical protein [Dermatobacter hominis]|uniref:hypothetical protein n=1 Tax=Dermatobacter hominis TaxID=2884263 RepID=UPI001D1079E9|nr:hypothetical protein [Dermatobacter hominis]UDY37131.1 hypothetical protein LH044_06230 [Dermatobacter hominis]